MRVEWPPGSGRVASYDAGELALVDELRAQYARGEITMPVLKNQIETMHELKVELDAHLVAPEPDFGGGVVRSLAAGRLARDEAMARVDRAAPEDWKEQAWATIEALAREQEYLVTDEIWHRLGWQPPEPRAMGPMMLKAARFGLVEKVEGGLRPGDRVINHARPQQVWRSLLYRLGLF